MPPSNEWTRSCEVVVDGKRRCQQCGEVKRHPEDFIGRRGGVVQSCSACAEAGALGRSREVVQLRRIVKAQAAELRATRRLLSIARRSA